MDCVYVLKIPQPGNNNFTMTLSITFATYITHLLTYYGFITPEIV